MQQSGSIEVQKSPVIRANCLLCIGLAELSILNERLPSAGFDYENICFFQPDCVENICSDGFYLTRASKTVVIEKPPTCQSLVALVDKPSIRGRITPACICRVFHDQIR